MSKKIMALILAFAMVFSTITVAFAEEPVAEVGPEAAALAKIEVLKGVDGVTAEYLKEAPTRLQAAIMLLRLKGLEEEAMKYESEDNFEDVKDYAWAEGKNIMAYLKANPTVGYRGTGNGFEPNKPITAKEYYKVLLVTLGYVENTADVAGDFTWETVEDKLKEVGLGKVLDVEAYTNNDMAIATVEALKLNMKDSEKTLLAYLIENGKVDEEKAIAADLMEEAKAVAVAVSSVTAIGNTVVEVVFKDDVDAAALENLDNYSIAGLEIKSAIATDSDTVRLETAAMTGGKAYTLVVGEEKVAFAGKAKVTGAPSLKSAKGTDTERVELVFDKALDFESATNVANYEIKDVTIVKAELDGDTVTLVTEGMVARKNYTVKITNIESIDGFVLKSASKVFLATSDTIAPKISSITALTNTRFELLFSEEVTKESAEDIANYKIRDTKDDTELTIEKIEINDNEDGVEVTTEPQIAGRKYEVAVNNIVDQSVLANVMTKESKKSFNGIKADTNGPRLKSAVAYSVNKVLLEFSEDGKTRLDEASVLDVNNYEVTNDLVVESVEKLAGDNKDFRCVMLTVSDIETKTYSLMVSNVEDEYGNVIKENSKITIQKGSKLPRVSTIVGAEAVDVNKVKVTFKDKIDKLDAENILNYSVNNDMGTPSKAKYDKVNKDNVTLTFNSDFVVGKKYTLTVSNITDFGGNIISGKPTFVGVANEVDLERPTVESVEILNASVLRVTFSEPIDNLLGETVDVALADVDLTDNNNYTTLTAKFVDENDTIAEYSGAYTFDNKYYVVRFGTDGTPIYNTTYQDKAGNKLELIDKDAAPGLKYIFDDVYGSKEPADNINLDSWEQTGFDEFTFYFSGNIGNYEDNTLTGISVDQGLTIAGLEVDAEDAAILVVTANNKFKNGTEYTFDFSGFKGPHGQDVKYNDKDTIKIEAYFVDEDSPYIESVEATYKDELKLTYNENIATAGVYVIKNEDDEKMAYSTPSISKNVVKLKLSGTKKFEAGKIYTVEVTTGALDEANNREEKGVEFSFEGTNLEAIDNYGTAYVINGEKFEIRTYSKINAASTAYTVDLAYGSVTDTNITTVDPSISAVKVDKLTVTIPGNNIKALLKDVTYTATVYADGTKELEVDFKGIITDGNITLTETAANSGDYLVSYGDVGSEDEVWYKVNNGIETQYSGAAITLNPTDKIDVWVERDGIIVYYLQNATR